MLCSNVTDVSTVCSSVALGLLQWKWEPLPGSGQGRGQPGGVEQGWSDHF